METSIMRFTLFWGILSLCLCLFSGGVLAFEKDYLLSESLSVSEVGGELAKDAVFDSPLILDALLMPSARHDLGQWAVSDGVVEGMRLLGTYDISFAAFGGVGLRVVLFEVFESAEFHVSNFLSPLFFQSNLGSRKASGQLTPELELGLVSCHVVVERIEGDSILLETPGGLFYVPREFLPNAMLQEGRVLEIVDAQGEHRRRLREASARIERMQSMSRGLVEAGERSSLRSALRFENLEPSS